MATSHEARCRLRVQTIIRTILDDERVVLGLDDLPANSDFFNNLSSAGQYALIMPASVSGFDFQARHYDIAIEVRLYFGMAADQDYSFTAIEDLFFGEVLQAVAARANYDGSDGVAPPTRDVEQDLQVGPELKPMAGFYSLTFHFVGSMNS